jgi:hypothetical protein
LDFLERFHIYKAAKYKPVLNELNVLVFNALLDIAIEKENRDRREMLVPLCITRYKHSHSHAFISAAEPM